jgi:hypothetical protein
MVQFFSPFIGTPSTSTPTVNICLFESATQICRLGLVEPTAGGTIQDYLAATVLYRFTPSAASHTYTVTAFASSVTGTPVVGAGASGTGAYGPAFIRFTKV